VSAEKERAVGFELARPADDLAIRALLARSAVPGSVTLTYEREPDYFLGCSVMGPLCQTLVARHAPTGEVIGLATRALRPRYVNGVAEEVGYIGQLRVDDRFQGRWLLAGGFRFFHELHGDGRTAGYLTTIIEGNQTAEGVLVGKARRSFPAYREVDRLCTLALILRRRGRLFLPPRTADVELRTGNEVALDDVITCFRRYGAARQFFPAYTAADLTGPATRDFKLDDLLVACRGGQVVGLLGLWDQNGYKQTVVQGYSPALRRLRPLYNLAARIAGAPPLTPLGRPLASVYAAFLCMADDDPALFALLLNRVVAQAAARGYAFLTLGLSTRDPLLPVAKRRLHIPYYSRVYTVCWPGDEHFHLQLDGRPPYVEIATL
jgi:hypothetical protein